MSSRLRFGRSRPGWRRLVVPILVASFLAATLIGVPPAPALAVTYLLSSFDGTHTGPRAIDGNSAPRYFKFDRSRAISPSQMPAGGSVSVTATLKVDEQAANWNPQGNLAAIGLLRDTGSDPSQGDLLLPAHDGDPILWFQNNNPGGVGFCWNKQFLVNNVFVFGTGAICGLPNSVCTRLLD